MFGSRTQVYCFDTLTFVKEERTIKISCKLQALKNTKVM